MFGDPIGDSRSEISPISNVFAFQVNANVIRRCGDGICIHCSMCVKHLDCKSLLIHARQNGKTGKFDAWFQAINGPLQQRTTILNSDYAGANTLPEDYDTDVESDWSNLSKLPRRSGMWT